MKARDKKESKARNWLAVDAHFRNSAGPFKKHDKNKCRKKINLDDAYFDYIEYEMDLSDVENEWFWYQEQEEELVKLGKIRDINDKMVYSDDEEVDNG